MNVIWIIGNGFDLNLGLKTGYRHFYDRCYSLLGDEEAASQRRRLDAIADKLGDCGDAWSDLEAFLGVSTAEFDSVDDHYACFQRMKVEMELYIEKQQERFEAPVQEPEFLAELVDSLVGFESRLDQSERDSLGAGSEGRLVAEVGIVTLNYTNCIEASLGELERNAAERSGPSASALKPGPVIHAHGSLDPPRQIVFATGDEGLITNYTFRRNEEFHQCWTKVGLDAVYGNGRLGQAFEAIAQADLIVTFGCSFGKTDQHLWSAVGRRMRESSDVRVVCFDKRLPEKHPDTLAHIRELRKVKERLAGLFSVSTIGSDADRIVVAPSTRVFRFVGSSAPVLSPDPYGEIEQRGGLLQLGEHRAPDVARMQAGGAGHAGTDIAGQAQIDEAMRAEMELALQAEMELEKQAAM